MDASKLIVTHMKTTIDNQLNTHRTRHPKRGTWTASRLAAVAAGGAALLLVGCGDRDREVTAYETTEQQEASTDVYATDATADDPSYVPPTGAGATAQADVTTETDTAAQTAQTDTTGAATTPGSTDYAADTTTTTDTTTTAGSEQTAQTGSTYATTGDAQSGQQATQDDPAQTSTSQGWASTGQQDETAQTSESQTYASTSQQAQTGSQDLEQRIRDNLRTAQTLDETQLEQIEIQVDQNNVTLAGTVPSEDVAEQIEQQVNQIPEVQSVENQLQVQGEVAAE